MKKRGLADFRSGTAILQRWDISTVADACMADFRRMALGEASLGPVYEVTGGKHIVLVFSADRDQWGRSVTDRVIAYVYDAERQELIGKFWLPMA